MISHDEALMLVGRLTIENFALQRDLAAARAELAALNAPAEPPPSTTPEP